MVWLNHGIISQLFVQKKISFSTRDTYASLTQLKIVKKLKFCTLRLQATTII